MHVIYHNKCLQYQTEQSSGGTTFDKESPCNTRLKCKTMQRQATSTLARPCSSQLHYKPFIVTELLKLV